MSGKAKAPKPDKRLERARQRGLADALAQERLALAAITKVILLEVDDPGRVMARLDAMVRAAETNRKVPPGTRRALLDGARLVRRAVERERGVVREEQRTLLDPPTPEPKQARIDELAASTDGPQQLGLVGNETIDDVAQAHEERVATIGRIHAVIVAILTDRGASCDTELHHAYAMRVMQGEPLPNQTKTAIVERRRELVAAGRLRSAGRRDRDGAALFDIVERELLEASA